MRFGWMGLAALVLSLGNLAAADVSPKATQLKAPGGVDWIGYRGPNGYAVYDTATPPKGKLKWRAPLPSWGFGSPIVVGDRVVVVVEPSDECDFAEALCLETKSGKELWRVPLDHSRAAGVNAAGVKAWSELFGRYRQAYTLAHQWHFGGDKAGAEAGLKKIGVTYSFRNWGMGILRNAKFDKGTYQDLKKQATAVGFKPETWWINCGMGIAAVGYAFATPVSDGEHIYISTGYDAFFCLDLDGKVKWVQFHKSDQRDEFTDCARSPLIWKDLLISDTGSLIRGIDRKTGKLKWSHPAKGGSILTPTIITVDGRDIVLHYPCGAVDLATGKKLTVNRPLGGGLGSTMITRYDQRDVTFHIGGGEHGGWESKGKGKVPPPAAVRWSLKGDALEGKVLWSGVLEKGVAHAGMVYHAGKVYFGKREGIVDADTGKVVGKARKADHVLYIVGGKQVSAVPGPTKDPVRKKKALDSIVNVGTTTITVPAPQKVDAARKAKRIATCGLAEWGFSYGSGGMAFQGRTMFIRGNDEIFCYE